MPSDLKPIEKPIIRACIEKWNRGRANHGGEFQGNPLEELFDELTDALNYVEEAQIRGIQMGSVWGDLLNIAHEVRDIWEETKEPVERPLSEYLERQWEWSLQTFGPGQRTKGVIQHITKELREIADNPEDLSEWVDVLILAMDGYWRHGGRPETLMTDLLAKQRKNFARKWPKPVSEDVATEHIREEAADGR